jgi:hypothetical protein
VKALIASHELPQRLAQVRPRERRLRVLGRSASTM